MTYEHALQVLVETEVLLLDFDGPICSVFAGLPAPVVANRLRRTFNRPLPAVIEMTSDPFDILIYAASLSAIDAQRIETVLRDHENEAVHTARPTPGAHDLIKAWTSAGRQLVIVSNNSKAAVITYLNIHHLAKAVQAISARESADVALLKPNPHLVANAARMSGASPSVCTLIGDSTTDIEAAQAAGARAIGYANTPGKVNQFHTLGPAAIVTELPTLDADPTTG